MIWIILFDSHTASSARQAAIMTGDTLQRCRMLHQACHLAAYVPGTLTTPPAAVAGAPTPPLLRVLRGGCGDLYAAAPTVFGSNLTGMEAATAAAVKQVAGGALLLRGTAWQLHGSCMNSQVCPFPSRESEH